MGKHKNFAPVIGYIEIRKRRLLVQVDRHGGYCWVVARSVGVAGLRLSDVERLVKGKSGAWKRLNDGKVQVI